MNWKPDRSKTAAAFVLVVAGWVRIALNHDLVLGGALIALGIIIAIRTAIYFLKTRS